MAMKCAQCGTRLVPGSRSCPGCGQQFATEVPPDPAPAAQAAPLYGQPQVNPPQEGQMPPYGQTPQYGQAPQYGQSPQGQPYGQSPQYGQPQANAQYGQTPAANSKTKNAYRWIGITFLIVMGIIRMLTYLGSTHGSASNPAQPATGDNSALIANMKTVGSLRDEFVSINQQAQPADAGWRARMEQNARDLKTASDQGVQYTWPDKFQSAQAPYREALTDYSYVCGRWPAAIEGGDQAAEQDCMNRFNAGDTGLKQVLAILKGGENGSQNLTGAFSVPNQK